MMILAISEGDPNSKQILEIIVVTISKAVLPSEGAARKNIQQKATK